MKEASKTLPLEPSSKADIETKSLFTLAGWTDVKAQSKGLLFILFAVLIFIFLGSKVDTDSFWVSLKSVPLEIWAIGLALVLVLPVIAALRWRIMLDGLDVQLAWRRCLILILGIYPINLISPSRLGDFLRAYALRDEVQPSKVIASVIAERVLDLLALSILCMAGGWHLGKIHSMVVAAGVMALVAFAVVLAMKLDNISLRHRWKEKVAAFSQALRVLMRSPHILAQVLGLAILHWFLTACLVALLFRGVAASVTFSEVLALAPIAIFIGLVPVTFGGMGTRDVAIVYMFAGTATTAQALAVSVLYTLFTYGVLALAGLPFTRRSLKI